ncbi:23S ribosomal RNA methyltransferase Erm [Mycolicibacterium vaccae]|jgi:23S rRNA (adenine-N6)-dimethyltransferase|uniref:rRNA (Adenine-N(6)-)-methyltransferase n=1 Tax=Mycolicibacterium vaccae ATCC 25954 TaxID=1194972 RepID=K0UYJ0_MYCVA|nr:23S ribosomal RNA methyltransferase Erm [Mycolicibacterium vaccae]ANI38522.1 23S rRNA methyltransferase [Mycolicibacterium vaccae 95051]EJZ11831.1 rRNA (adenine-N(6)-)-methyltransferase [Mycolicibacterium vaccae ATCC 25954]MCV7061444.1 23S ribosomal RNA methyltransferase Erm [Mycolicibacterium vaccae]
MPTYGNGRHEHGQNFLIHPEIRDGIVDLVAATDGPIVEIGPGRGALTFKLQDLGRSLTVVEIDTRHARSLRARTVPSTTVVESDFLRWPLPNHPHVIVGNLPFHQTTAMLRRILHAPHWTHAVLLVQWEVARRRAAVGGATMMTAQWWPWMEFTLEGRVPAAAFRPRPTVDGGLLVVSRRREAWLPAADRRRYQRFVHTVFTGKRRYLDALLPRGVLPRDLSAAQWVALYRQSVGLSPASRGRRP